MYPLYRDLRDRLGPPLWHDWQGVPRYTPFQPDDQDLYADHAALVLVGCAACGARFPVGACTPGLAWDPYTGSLAAVVLPTPAQPGWIAWGDAPWHDGGGQCAGTTMGADLLAIVEYWRRDGVRWVRQPDREGPWVAVP